MAYGKVLERPSLLNVGKGGLKVLELLVDFGYSLLCLVDLFACDI